MKKEVLDLLSKKCMPRASDALLQVAFLVLLILLDRRLGIGVFWPDLANPQPFSVESLIGGIWFVSVIGLWGAQNFILGKVLRHRIAQSEASFSDLSKGLHSVMSKACIPHAMDAFFQFMGVVLFLNFIYHESMSSWFLSLPEPLPEYSWIVVLVPLWLLQNYYLRLILRDRVRRQFFEHMYYNQRSSHEPSTSNV